MSNVDLLNLNPNRVFKISGAVSGDWTGNSVSNAGDINGDGFDDIVVGALTASPNGRNNAGAAYVIYGKSTGLTNLDLANLTVAQGFKILGAIGGDSTGRSVSSAGDINGDGFNDIIVAAPDANPNGRFNAGAVYVIYGKSTGLTNIDLANFTSAQGFKILGADGGLILLMILVIQ